MYFAQYPLGNPDYSPVNVYPNVDEFTGFVDNLHNSGLNPQFGLGQTIVNAIVMQPGWVRNPNAVQQTLQLIPELDGTIGLGQSVLEEVSNTRFYTGSSSVSTNFSDPFSAFTVPPYYTFTQNGIYLGSPSPTGNFQPPLLGG
ncbi:MAG: hypothetical protein AAFQ80_04275 [Cyanobacteria bacterium J06621_8]